MERACDSAAVIRWTALVVTGERVWPVELSTHRPVMVGRGRQAAIELSEGPDRVATLTVRDEWVDWETARGAPATSLNDVPMSGAVRVSSGDEVRVGAVRIVFARSSSQTAPRPRLKPFDEWSSALDEELRRTTGGVVGVVVLAPASANVAARQALFRRVVDEAAKAGGRASWGELGDLIVGSFSALDPEALSSVLTRVRATAGARVRVVDASAPRDGHELEALIGRVWTRLLGEAIDQDEPVVADPVMVRLFGLMEELAPRTGPVCLVGPPGSGRRTLALRLAAASSQRALEVRGDDVVALTEACRTAPLVLATDCGPEALALAARAPARVLATTRASPKMFDVVVQVPALAARPLDVPAMAEVFLSRARELLSRPRLHLGPDALPLLSAWAWPGNVRELKNVMLRAARAAVRDEVSRDSLPAQLAELAPREDLRGAMVAAERELLLEALARTRWNVSAAAARLGMPRRTVVYRLARLGLKRPVR